jgi:hypothetical protein
VATQIPQECLEIVLSLAGPTQDQSMPCTWVDRAKEDTLGIFTGDLDLGLRAAKRPGVPQWREPPQDRGIDHQQYRFGWHVLYAADKAPFFWARFGSLLA